MTIDKSALVQLVELVQRVADEELVPRFCRVATQCKADGTPVTEADLAMQRRLQQELAARWPQVRMLGEEMSGEEQHAALRSADAGLWCLDPLDGTTNYAAGIPCYAVSLAYIENGRIQAGVVYDPSRGECFSALAGEGAWLNGEPLTVGNYAGQLREAVALVDLKRLPANLIWPLIQHPPYRSQRSIGSVAIDWCWMAAGRCQLYLHGGQRLWDYAAGSLIYREAGGPGGLLGELSGDWLEDISLTPRLAVAAVNETLLASWREWLQGKQINGGIGPRV